MYSQQLTLDFKESKPDKLWGQRTQFACLLNKEDDFQAELALFAQCAPYQPALKGLFCQMTLL